jgi:hypothetical protein
MQYIADRRVIAQGVSGAKNIQPQILLEMRQKIE